MHFYWILNICTFSFMSIALCATSTLGTAATSTSWSVTAVVESTSVIASLALMPRLPRFSPSGGSSTKKGRTFSRPPCLLFLSLRSQHTSSFSPLPHPQLPWLCWSGESKLDPKLESGAYWCLLFTTIFLKKHQKKERFQKDRKQEWQNWEE